MLKFQLSLLMAVSAICGSVSAESIRDDFRRIPDLGQKIALTPSVLIQHLVVDEPNDYIDFDYFLGATSDMKQEDIENNISKYHYAFTAFKRANGEKLYALSMHLDGIGDERDKSSITFYQMVDGRLKQVNSNTILPTFRLEQFLATGHSVPSKLSRAAQTACKPSPCALYMIRYTLPQHGTTMLIRAEPLDAGTPDNPNNWIESQYQDGNVEEYLKLFEGSYGFELNWDKDQGVFKIGRKISVK